MVAISVAAKAGSHRRILKSWGEIRLQHRQYEHIQIEELRFLLLNSMSTVFNGVSAVDLPLFIFDKLMLKIVS